MIAFDPLGWRIDNKALNDYSAGLNLEELSIPLSSFSSLTLQHPPIHRKIFAELMVRSHGAYYTA